VTHGKDAVVFHILRQHLLKVGVMGVEAQRGRNLNLGIVAHLRSHKLRGLQGALQWAGDDHIHLYFERAQGARHEDALLLTFFNKGALLVEKRILAIKSSIGMTHEV
jgi:hypothetical protein